MLLCFATLVLMQIRIFCMLRWFVLLLLIQELLRQSTILARVILLMLLPYIVPMSVFIPHDLFSSGKC